MSNIEPSILNKSSDLTQHHLTQEEINRWELPEFEEFELKPRGTKYCFAVITWNEGERIKKQLKRMKQNLHLADIIIADGDSEDGSTEHRFLKEQGVRTLLVTKERGLCTAIRMALAYGLMQGYEGIVTVNGNGKDGIEALPDFLTALDEGCDIVQGSRFIKGGMHKNTPLLRYLGIKFVYSPILSLASGFYLTDPTNGFRAVSRRFLLDKRVLPFRKEFIRFNLEYYLDYRAARLGYKIKEIPVSRVYPGDGSIPTKIHGLSVLTNILEMVKVAVGSYNPEK